MPGLQGCAYLEGQSWHALCSGEGEKLDLDAERKVRTPEEMAAEAQELRVAFQQLHSTEQT